LLHCLLGRPQGAAGSRRGGFSQDQVQLSIVHKVRGAMKYVPWKERKAVAADLRAVMALPPCGEVEQALDRFSERWDRKCRAISPSWRADWQRLTVFFDYPHEIRRVIYITNAIESLNYSLRTVLENRGAFPNDESIVKLLYMYGSQQCGEEMDPPDKGLENGSQSIHHTSW
jgi:putative transposase